MYENAQTFFFPIIAVAFQIVFGIVLVAILRIPAVRKRIAKKEDEEFGLQNIGYTDK